MRDPMVPDAPAHPAVPHLKDESAPEPAPTIHVTIGRVEVRAVLPSPPQPPSRPPTRLPKLSLDDYLRLSHGGKP
jgi:hypothetical protein